MRSWLRASWIAIAGIALAGCAAQNAGVPETMLLSQFETGDAALSCTINCQFAWVGQRSNALRLYNSEHWRELAVLVMRVGYRSDLTYFYLGRAAEGLSYPVAAERYYRVSEQLSDSELACAHGTNSCDGIALPGMAAARLRAVEAALAPPPPPPRHVVRHYRKPTTPTAAAAPAPSVHIPPASASSSSSGAPASTAAPSGGGPGASGGVYIPPAQK
jgi:hypothetical protein